MKILAIDPGPKQSAWCRYVGWSIEAAIVPNEDLLFQLRHGELRWPAVDVLAVEMIASYGMSVGKEVFETCVWIGRFIEAWERHRGSPFVLVPRLDVKMALCHNSRANDSNIRQALIDRFGAPGTKKAPGRTYGLKGDCWSALGVACVIADRRGFALDGSTELARAEVPVTVADGRAG